MGDRSNFAQLNYRQRLRTVCEFPKHMLPLTYIFIYYIFYNNNNIINTPLINSLCPFTRWFACIVSSSAPTVSVRQTDGTFFSVLEYIHALIFKHSRVLTAVHASFTRILNFKFSAKFLSRPVSDYLPQSATRDQAVPRRSKRIQILAPI